MKQSGSRSSQDIDMVRIWKQYGQDMEAVYLHYELEMVLGRYILLLPMTVLANDNHI
jgi:hypothetical protein